MRFETLKRDGFTCQYCGGTAPDVTLTVDHVIPVALGGEDVPENLVAACRDCNAGKASVHPDAPLVQRVSDTALAFALSVAEQMTQIRGRLQPEQDYIERFDDYWLLYNMSGEPVPRPLWRHSVRRWYAMGVPEELLESAIDIAMGNEKVAPDAKFKYACGVVWTALRNEDVRFVPATPEEVHLYTQADVDEMVAEAYAQGGADR